MRKAVCFNGQSKLPFFLLLWTLLLHSPIVPVNARNATSLDIGWLVRLHGNTGDPLGTAFKQFVAAGQMAVHHVNHRVTTLVPRGEELLPPEFSVSVAVSDSYSSPSIGVKHAFTWNEAGVDVIISSYRSAVTGPVALAASVADTPVIAWASTATALSDRATYNLLSRITPNDSYTAASIAKIIRKFGWVEIAILSVDDAYGRSVTADLAKEAENNGVQVVSTQLFLTGNEAAIRQAVADIAVSSARIIVAAMFDVDVPLVLRAAVNNSIVGQGYIWLTTDAFSMAGVLAHDVGLAEHVGGWFQFVPNALHGTNGQRFVGAMATEPLNNIQHPLNNVSREELDSIAPQTYAAFLYDAVWAAAIAASRTPMDQQNRTDKSQLLRNIREVAFQGASGWVEFDSETGERKSSKVPVEMLNFAIGEDGALESRVVWQWTEVAGLQQVPGPPPLWPGGERTWKLPPARVCAPGSVFSSETLRCEACPPRSEEVGGVCMEFNASIGVLLRLNGDTVSDLWKKIAASALMAVDHVRTRNAVLVPAAKTLLPAHFRVEFEMRDTFSSASLSVAHAVEWGDQGRDIIVGAALSAVTGPVALAAAIKSTPVISYASTSAALSDKQVFPGLSRTCPSDRHLAEMVLGMVRDMGWRRVGVLVANDAFGRGFGTDLAHWASVLDVEIAAAQNYASDGGLVDEASVAAAMETLRDSYARVIVSAIADDDILGVLPVAERFGMLGEGHVWLTLPGYNPEDIVKRSSDPARTAVQMTGWLQAEVTTQLGVEERFSEVLLQQPLETLQHPLMPVSTASLSGGCSSLCAYAYDAVWLAAIAASRAGKGKDGERDPAQLLRDIRSAEWEGASGQVRLQDNGDRLAGLVLLVKNLQPRLADGGHTDSVAARTVWSWSEQGLERLAPDSEPPFWSADSRSWEPPRDGASCPAGFVYSDGAQGCEACARGTYQQSVRCVQCPAGSIAPAAASTQCSRCQQGFAPEEGMSECIPCPANSVRTPSSLGLNRSECVCTAGHYHNVDTLECVLCPSGAICEGGVQKPYPRPGFWGDRECEALGGSKTCEEGDKFLRCHPQEFCEGGPDFKCMQGRTGWLCQHIREGWFSIGQVLHLECGDWGKVITVVAILGVVLVWYAINKVASGNYDALDVCLLYVQVTGMIGTFQATIALGKTDGASSDVERGPQLKWDSTLHQLNTALSIANFDVDFVAPLCFGRWTKVQSFFLQLLLPFLFGFFILVRCCVLQLVAWSRGKPRAHWIHHMQCLIRRRMISVVMVVYHTLCINCFQVFRCEKFPSGENVMWFAPEVTCWKGMHWVMVGVSVGYFFLVIMLVPLMMAWAVHHYQKLGELHAAKAVKQWAFTHRRYEADYKYWELMLCCRRLLVAICSVAIKNSMIQAAITMVTLTGLLTAHVFTRPYIDSSIDALDFFSIVGSMLYVLAGLLMYPSLSEQSQGLVCENSGVGWDESSDEPCSEDRHIKLVVSYMTFVLTMLTLFIAGVLTVHFVLEIRQSRQAFRAISKHVSWQMQRMVSGSIPSVDESRNKESLASMLDGAMLLRWARKVTEAIGADTSSVPTASGAANSSQSSPMVGMMRWVRRAWNEGESTEEDAEEPVAPLDPIPENLHTYRAALDTFMQLESALRSVEVDLTHYSEEPKARVMRRLTEIEGFVDFLSCCKEDGRQGLELFFDQYTDFVEKHRDDEVAKMAVSRVKSAMGVQIVFPLTDLVREEHLPLMGYLLMKSKVEERRSFWKLMDSILEASGRQPLHLSHISQRNLQHYDRGRWGWMRAIIQANREKMANMHMSRRPSVLVLSRAVTHTDSNRSAQTGQRRDSGLLHLSDGAGRRVRASGGVRNSTPANDVQEDSGASLMRGADAAIQSIGTQGLAESSWQRRILDLDVVVDELAAQPCAEDSCSARSKQRHGTSPLPRQPSELEDAPGHNPTYMEAEPALLIPAKAAEHRAATLDVAAEHAHVPTHKMDRNAGAAPTAKDGKQVFVSPFGSVGGKRVLVLSPTGSPMRTGKRGATLLTARKSKHVQPAKLSTSRMEVEAVRPPAILRESASSRPERPSNANAAPHPAAVSMVDGMAAKADGTVQRRARPRLSDTETSHVAGPAPPYTSPSPSSSLPPNGVNSTAVQHPRSSNGQLKDWASALSP